ncbi:MAG TPA: hypothetical protein VN883_10865 [Myxococcales bacterium]|nr:hypothetical protein [Myxococcales bacterium]
MTLAALVGLVALAFAALSLVRLSRLPKAPLPPPEERTWGTLRAGDVVLTPDGDWLVESRAGVDGADVFALRSGRSRRWLLVRPDGKVALADDPPGSTEPEALKGQLLDRASVELLAGA